MHYVPDSGTILDVASGHYPFPRATILSERYLGDTLDRKEALTRDARPMVVLDIHHLPFKAKSVDYIYCSHVLEHIEDPERACAELMRVGKAGYIETPTLMKDSLFAWAEDIHHKWHVVHINNRLVFFEYDSRRKAGIRTSQWRKSILSRSYHQNQDIYFQNLDIFNNILEWRDHFFVSVFRQDGDQA
jgi:ubiquinone/menaquinone biosynthesis C-methylase UbiE